MLGIAHQFGSKMSRYILTNEKIIENDLGDIIHILKNESIGFDGFGEVYISKLKKGSLKGWKKHTRMVSNIKVIKGEVCFYFEEENESISEVLLSSSSSIRLTIYPDTWFAFSSFGRDSEILNIANIKHDPDEQLLKPFDTTLISGD